jgi:hypothetical protein
MVVATAAKGAVLWRDTSETDNLLGTSILCLFSTQHYLHDYGQAMTFDAVFVARADFAAHC